MKKLFTLIAATLLAGNLSAQTDIVILSADNYDGKNSTNDLWKFDDTDITIVPTGGRAAGPKTFPEGAAGDAIEYRALNIKKNGEEVIKLGNASLYRIEMFGFSQGDNFTYLYGYGATGADNYLWKEVALGTTDNATINGYTYPIDPCGYKGSRVAESTRQVGYCVAAIDFGDTPVTKEFAFTVSGNNQSDLNYKLYLSRAAADASTTNTGDAPNANTPGFVTAVSAITTAMQPTNSVIYNIAGQQVNDSYKGLVILNGRKYFRNRIE